jgi:hypothetical protein
MSEICKKPIQDRLDFGKIGEADICKAIIDLKILGDQYTLVSSNSNEDMKEKIDVWIINVDKVKYLENKSKEERLQFLENNAKCVALRRRDENSGSDIGLCIAQPFYKVEEKRFLLARI